MKNIVNVYIYNSSGVSRTPHGALCDRSQLSEVNVTMNSIANNLGAINMPLNRFHLKANP